MWPNTFRPQGFFVLVRPLKSFYLNLRPETRSFGRTTIAYDLPFSTRAFYPTKHLCTIPRTPPRSSIGRGIRILPSTGAFEYGCTSTEDTGCASQRQRCREAITDFDRGPLLQRGEFSISLSTNDREELALTRVDLQLQTSSIWASLGSSIGITAAIALAFSFLRPYNTVVYAPKLKHADEIHSPPPLGKGLFAWVMPLWRTTEKDIVRYAGMDAALFMRFITMCRNMFVIMAVLGCAVLVPINLTQSIKYDSDSWLYRL